MKLGEEAQVDLDGVHAGGRPGVEAPPGGSPAREGRRLVPRREAAEVPAVLSQLRAVSDDWLAAKAGAEKGFSLGFFDEAYLTRFPVAVIERDGRIRGLRQLWPGPGSDELSIDLMRYHRDAPKA